MEILEREIKTMLENVACLGRDAYGEYIDKCTKGLIESIKAQAEMGLIDPDNWKKEKK